MTDNHDPGAKFLSLAVHEFRTPVSVVGGYLRMLLRHFGDSLTEQQRTLAELGERSCGSLAVLLAELSDLAEFEGGQTTLRREPIGLATLLAAAAQGVHEGHDRGITLGVRPCEPDVQVLGDPARLSTAFATLATAVLRERADAVSILIACRIVDAGKGRVAHVAMAEAAGIDSVLDHPAADAFDEYRSGLGFRLVMASRVVGAHGGRIVSPVAARGRLSVVVSLPVAEGPG
jgi:K+-sensing histidine kinase KdpD